MANRFWVGGTNAWDGTQLTKWATTSGGAGGSSVPSSSDDVFFDAASGAVTVTISDTRSCKSLNFTGFTGTLAGTGTINADGPSVIFSSGMSTTYTGTITAGVTAFPSSVSLTTGGLNLTNSFVFTGNSLTHQILDSLTTTGGITISGSTFNTNGNNITCGAFTMSNLFSTVVNLSSSYLTCSSYTMSSSVTLNSGTSTIEMTGASTFDGEGKTYNEVRLTSSGTVTITGTNTFATLKRTPSSGPSNLVISANQTISSNVEFTASDPFSQRLSVYSSSVGVQRTLTANGTVSISGINFQDIVGAGTGTWAGTSITDNGNNSGITFTSPRSTSLTEIMSFIDSSTAAWAKMLDEILAFNDSVYKSIQTTKQEFVTASDNIVKSISRSINEALVLADNVVKALIRTFSEAIAMVDNNVRTRLLSLSEVISFTDTVIEKFISQISAAKKQFGTMKKIITNQFSKANVVNMDTGSARKLNIVNPGSSSANLKKTLDMNTGSMRRPRL